jgi:hypothetical protein
MKYVDNSLHDLVIRQVGQSQHGLPMKYVDNALHDLVIRQVG